MKRRKKLEQICCRCGHSNRDERRGCSYMGTSWKRHDYANNLENYLPKRIPGDNEGRK